MGKKQRRDLAGKRFGRWLVLEEAKESNGRRYWKCQCSCEEKTIRVVEENSLLCGNSTSCGCLTREKTAEANRRRTKRCIYDLTGKYGIGYTVNTNEPFYFDLEDFDKIKDFSWGARHDKRRNTKTYYIEAHFYTKDGENKRIHLHHFILGHDDIKAEEKITVDHINQITYDCRKSNLRITTKRGNAINKPRQSTNTSGVIGVNYNKVNKVWVARINDELNHRIILCQTKDKNEAIIARLVAEKQYYGKFAPSVTCLRNMEYD